MGAQVKSKARLPRRLDPLAIAPFVAFALIYLILPRFLQERTLNSVVYIGIYVLLALGLNLLMGYAGQISLGHAAFFGLGAYASAIITLQPIQSEIIPGFSGGFGLLAGTAALLAVTRASGWRLAIGVGSLLGLTLLTRSMHLPLALALLMVGMALVGLVLRVGWLKGALSGVVTLSAAIICNRFLEHVLANSINGIQTSPWTGIAAGVVITSLIGYLIGAQILRLKGNYLAMGTLAFGIIVETIFGKWVAVTGGSSDGICGIPTIAFVDGLPRPVQHLLSAVQSVHLPGFLRHFANAPQTDGLDPLQQYYYLVWLLVFVALLLAVNIVKSRVGRAFRAVHGSEQAAESLGVDTERYKIQVFVLSAALASIAGSLYAHVPNVGYVCPSQFGMMVSVQLVVIVVIGGLASVWGALIGATVIQLIKVWIPTLDKADISLFGLALKNLDPIVFGGILILVMMLMPQGLTRGLTDMAAAAIRGARLRLRHKGAKA